MINETINQTAEKVAEITFENWTAISTSPMFLTAMILAWLVPLIIYFIIGACVGYKGTYVKKKMIEFPNFWYGILVFGLISALLILVLIIFPLWLKWFQI